MDKGKRGDALATPFLGLGGWGYSTGAVEDDMLGDCEADDADLAEVACDAAGGGGHAPLLP